MESFKEVPCAIGIMYKDNWNCYWTYDANDQVFVRHGDDFKLKKLEDYNHIVHSKYEVRLARESRRQDEKYMELYVWN
jgi:hypothetical protein